MGMNGWLAGEYIAAGIEQAGAGIRANAAATERLKSTQKLIKKLEDTESFNAGNLAEKQALREALKKLDPKHPLMTSADLRSKITNAGMKAFSITKNWDAARDAGGTFKY